MNLSRLKCLLERPSVCKQHVLDFVALKNKSVDGWNCKCVKYLSHGFCHKRCVNVLSKNNA
jgi:hypothetical protein